MRDKIEQIELSYKRIDDQAKELIEVYGWDKDFIDKKARELRGSVIPEVKSFGDMEDVSGCWSLIRWIKKEKNCLGHNLKSLEDSNRNRYYELMDVSSQITDAFRYIQDNNLDIETYAGIKGNDPNELIYAIKAKDGVFLHWSIEDVELAFKQQGAFEVAKRLHKSLVEYNSTTA